MDHYALGLLTQNISQIKWMVVAILTIFFLGLAGIILLIILLKKFYSEQKLTDNFQKTARELLDKNDLDGAIKLSSEKVQKHPGDSYGHWFLGLAYYRQKNWHKALDEFKLLSEIEPSWKEEYVDPYLADLKIRIKNFKPTIVKDKDKC